MPTPNTTDLKKFAAAARRQLREQVAGRLEQVLRTDSAELRERESALKELRAQIAQTSKKDVIDRVAYTWFNRFCALRFMDVNRYTRLGIVSPAEGLSQPEVLQEAKRGYIDEDLGRFVEPKQIFELLNGQRPSSDPQGEAYRLLLVAACNFYGEVMPFMFEKIADYTELLMPLDLLSEHAVLHGLREALSAEACQDVEVIGWLYQYYIAERKDEVFEALKQNQKIEAGDIPAATQLFTPHWIVRYLVENSLGRLWMLNHPESRLVEKMEYYIESKDEGGRMKDEENQTFSLHNSSFILLNSPEDIRLADPACGSGHMLTYAFDLLYAIYEETGQAAADIPRLILEKNLYGIEIDGRAGALAAFALFMKARARDRRWFSRPAQPQICVLENVTFTDQELDEYLGAVESGKWEVRSDLFTSTLRETLRQFEQAGNFGSLIRPLIGDAAFARGMLENKQPGLFLHHVHEKALKVLRFAEFLSPRYHVVVANPPYMGGGGMNDLMRDFSKSLYPDSKADLFSMFIDRCPTLLQKFGLLGMITMQGWMFLSSFESLRTSILQNKTILSMAHLGAHAFDTIGGEVVSTTAFILENAKNPKYRGKYQRLIEGSCEADKDRMLHENNSSLIFSASSEDFAKIPGSPIAYWASENIRNIFVRTSNLGSIATPRAGLATGDNTKYQRFWHEVAFETITFTCKSTDESKVLTQKWYPCNSGGNFRKWFGNNETIVNWQYDGKEIRNFKGENGRLKSRPQNTQFFFKPGVTWTKLSASIFASRLRENGFIFDDTGRSAFPNDENLIKPLLGLMCSRVSSNFLEFLNPSMSFTSGDIAKIPTSAEILASCEIPVVDAIISLSRDDWDSQETSWDFRNLLILKHAQGLDVLSDAYKSVRSSWREILLKIKHLEERNNLLFIEAYGLQDELTPEVPLEEITLTCNPRYRYGGNRSDEELEALLKADTMKEFISYAVGCMFGRYSLEKPGLVLANAGEGVEEYWRQVEAYRQMADDGQPTAVHRLPSAVFAPDPDNVIPVLDGEWFSDDITERFKKFLRVTFGEEHYDENLAFIEEAIGRDVRSYFVKEFYKEHVSMYKKRPIYWMFSSPKGSFQALIYMHRYKPDTLSILLKTLRDFRDKLGAKKAFLEQVSISGSASAREKTAALKEIEKLNATLEELRAYERETLYPLATQKIQIDLDDGVKVNYSKFGPALVKIVGL
jgi:type II restriction/modification system DNA methylase subunit YeeA